MNLVELEISERKKVEHFFADTCDTAVYSSLQGYMGKAWTDSKENPAFAILRVGDIVFLGGDETAFTDEMMDEFFALSGMKMGVFMCINPSFGERLEAHYGNKCTKVERYRVEKHGNFDYDLLKSYVEKIPDGYHVLPLCSEWCNIALSKEWSKDWLSNFSSIEDYEENGIGQIIIKTDESFCSTCEDSVSCTYYTGICPKNSVIVGGASSYSIYDEGLEVQIDTHEDYRRNGFAVIAGAALILACRERGLFPHWDAANMSSVHVAEKLGYTYEGPYVAYEINA